MVYLLKNGGSFHGYVSHSQMVSEIPRKISLRGEGFPGGGGGRSQRAGPCCADAGLHLGGTRMGGEGGGGDAWGKIRSGKWP